MNGNIGANIETLEYIKNYKYEDDDKSLKLTSIIIVTYNHFQYTKICIESIRKFTLKSHYEIIVIDNNSQDETVNWLQNQKDLIVIYNHENKGFPAACNQGIKIAKGDNILLLNNDVIVTPYWLNNLEKALYSNENIGAVSCISNSSSNYQEIKSDYENIEEMIQFSLKVNIANLKEWDYRTRLIGFCFMVKKEIVDKIGGLDERFTPGNFEDDDFSLRIIKEGYKLLLCKDVFIHHFGSISFNKLSKDYIQLYINNNNKLKQKWNFNFEYIGSHTQEIMKALPENKEKNLRFLEIGCKVGSNLLEIKNIYKDAEIYGVDKSIECCDICKNIFTVVNADIENVDLPYDEKFFDCIILDNVIQEFIDPSKVLIKLKKYLKDSGNIIMSVPNIMNARILRNLVNGYFKYKDGGILSKNTMRFFTLAQIVDLVKSAEFKIELIEGILNELAYEENQFIEAIALLSNENIKFQYKVYKYVLRIS